MKELNRDEAEALAAKWPLPEFENEKDECETCCDFVKNRAFGIAHSLLGSSSNTLAIFRREWKQHRQFILEGRRFQNWIRATRTQWDEHRGKFLSLNPDAQP